jgi:hypothetical protein
MGQFVTHLRHFVAGVYHFVEIDREEQIRIRLVVRWRGGQAGNAATVLAVPFYRFYEFGSTLKTTAESSRA